MVKKINSVSNILKSSIFCLTVVFVPPFCLCFFKREQEEIEKHVTIHLSDFVPERGKQRHTHLCFGAGLEPPQSVPVPGKSYRNTAKIVSYIYSFMCVL